jgi:branched-chain amino acid transport system substrate-binding protein
MREALAKLKVASGPASLMPDDLLDFDAEGQNKIGNIMAQVVDGKFVTVWPEAYASQPFKAPKK